MNERAFVILPPGSSDDFAAGSLRIPQTLTHTTTTQTVANPYTVGKWITISNSASTEVYIRLHSTSSTTLVTANDLKLGPSQERHFCVQNESRYVSARSVDGASAFDVRVYESSN